MSEHPPTNDLLDRIPGLTPPVRRTARRRVPVWAITGLILLAVAVIGFLLYQFVPLGAPIPDDLGAHYAGLERSTTDQGFARLGRADAPVIVEEFSSYACPHCRDFHQEQFPALLDEIAAGQVQFILIPVSHIGPGAGDAARAAICAGEQGQFWEMSDVLFDWQKRFVTLTFAERRLLKGAEAMGLDVDAFEQCLDSRATETIIEAARREFDWRGLTGTPSFFINGQKARDYRELDNLGATP